MGKATCKKVPYFGLWFQRVQVHNSRDSMTKGGTPISRSRYLSVHIFNHRRVNQNCYESLNYQSLPLVKYFLQIMLQSQTSPKHCNQLENNGLKNVTHGKLFPVTHYSSIDPSTREYEAGKFFLSPACVSCLKTTSMSD